MHRTLTKLLENCLEYVMHCHGDKDSYVSIQYSQEIREEVVGEKFGKLNVQFANFVYSA